MDKIKFRDLMQALNSKRYNIDKFEIIECYCASRFTVGQIRLLFSSLSTSNFRYRALLILVEYMPELDEQDVLHVVSAISECESHREIRVRALNLLSRANKLSDPGLRKLVYKKIIGLSTTSEEMMEINIATQFESDIQQLEDSKLSSFHSPNIKELPTATSIKESRRQRAQDRRKYMLNNRIYPLSLKSAFDIEESASASSLAAQSKLKCCIS